MYERSELGIGREKRGTEWRKGRRRSASEERG